MPGMVKLGLTLLLVSALCWVIPSFTHSGIGSCGFYGPTSLLILPGILLLPAAAGILIQQAIAHAIPLWRSASHYAND